MKHFSTILLLKLLFISVISVSAQTETSIWTFDTIKTFDGQQANFLQSVEQNWAKARAALKEKGKIKSFRVLSVKPAASLQWDVLLITEYANRETFEKRETIFAEVFKALPTVLINGKDTRDMAKPVNSDVGYEQVLSSEKLLESINTTEAVRVPLNNYIKAHATGNADLIRQAFWKESRIMAFGNDKLTNLSVEEFASRFNGKPAEDEAKRKRTIESIDVSGNAATAKIILDYPAVRFVDYMSLLKIGGEWKIVNKSFYAEPKVEVKK